MAVGALHEITPDLVLIEGRHPHTLWGDPDVPTIAVYRRGPRLYLLDTGAGPEQEAAIRAVAARYTGIEEVLLLNSHGHPDHLGNNHVLAAIPAARRRHHIARAARPALDHAAFFARMYRTGLEYFDYLDGLDLAPDRLADLLRALGAPPTLTADDVADLGERMARLGLGPALRGFVPSLVVDVLLRTYPAIHASVGTMVDYEDLGPAEEIAIGSTGWTGWTFADERGEPEVEVLESAGHSAGGVVYHLPGARFLMLADETSALPIWTDADPRRTAATASRAMSLVDEGLLDGIGAGHSPMLPVHGGEARARLQQILDAGQEFTAAVEAVLRRHPAGLCIDALYSELRAEAAPRSVIAVQAGLQFPVFGTFLKLTLLNHCLLLGLPVGSDAAGRPTFRLP
ncbi:MBL fold metallo-hydrolase [Actinomycetospora rhizophila]|uniref:MBL fold metallo-hydrolase n=1 Tax=Actinomycetospora rhizophila TaxID=1416876 RepID=A0ABV9ZHM6_9PSEU